MRGDAFVQHLALGYMDAMTEQYMRALRRGDHDELRRMFANSKSLLSAKATRPDRSRIS